MLSQFADITPLIHSNSLVNYTHWHKSQTQGTSYIFHKWLVDSLEAGWYDVDGGFLEDDEIMGNCRRW